MTIIKGTVKIKVATVLPDEADNKDADLYKAMNMVFLDVNS